MMKRKSVERATSLPADTTRIPYGVDDRAGWHVIPWCRSAGICKATLHNLPPECAPASTTIGKRRIIHESPRAWLERIARRGGAPTSRSALTTRPALTGDSVGAAGTKAAKS